MGFVLYNEEKHFQCIEQSVQLFRRHGISCILVDNASTDATRGWIQKISKKYNAKALIRSENHMGAARADVVNAAQTEWVGFVDGDCRVPPTWPAGALKNLKTNSKAAAIGGPLRSAGEKKELFSRLFKSFLGNMNSAQVKGFTKAGPIRHLPTANVIYRREVILQLGNFDLSKVRVGEDLEMSYRLNQSGQTLWLDPAMQLEHLLPESFSVWLRKVFYYGTARGEVGRQYGVLCTPPFLLPLIFLVFLVLNIFFVTEVRGLPFVIYLLVLMGYAVADGGRLAGHLFIYFLGTHLAYSLGLAVGIVKSFFPVRRSAH